jgi:murein DD-endopeptidase MepM/ murein hydrolase activator NlpD
MLSRILRQPESIQDNMMIESAINAPFSGIEVRVVPENVTVLPKVEAAPKERAIEERTHVLKKGETLDTVVRNAGLNSDSLKTLIPALGGRSKINSLEEGQTLRITLAPALTQNVRQVVRVMLIGENGAEAIAATNDQGQFVSVNVPASATTTRKVQTASNRETPAEDEESAEEEDENEGTGARLYESLYETAAKYNLATSTVQDLLRIFSYDFDFQKRVSPSDALEIFFVQDEEGGGSGEMLYAALTFGGEKRQVYRYVSPDDGAIDYFDEAGRSLKKFLMRKPMAEGKFRSAFGYRRHPILGYTKMHTGVDWSNRIGTPIFAAGNGLVTLAGWEGGYGRRIEIQHTNGYVTTYSHMSAFARGMQVGTRVKQGQIIGYVGSTGLSTGPHLHYEVMVNGKFVDPMRIRVPRGKELDGRALAEFKRQREQADALISRAGNSSADGASGTRETL